MKKKKKKSQELINNASFNANDRHFKNEYTGKKQKKNKKQSNICITFSLIYIPT